MGKGGDDEDYKVWGSAWARGWRTWHEGLAEKRGSDILVSSISTTATAYALVNYRWIQSQHNRLFSSMVLQDLGRRINAAVSDLTRSNSLDEKVISPLVPLIL
jgi:hypothetical protein